MRKFLLLIAVIVSAAVLLTGALFAQTPASEKSAPEEAAVEESAPVAPEPVSSAPGVPAVIRAIGGRLDVSGMDLKKSGPIALAGEWEFIRGQFMAPEEYLYWTELEFRRLPNREPVRPRRFLDLPGDWDRVDLPGVRRGTGHGTFILRLSGLPLDEEVALRVGRVGAAYRLYVIPASHLELVRDKHEFEESPFRPFLRKGYADEIYSVPHFAPSLRVYTPVDEAVYIILHVANHDAARGGLLEPIFLGREKELRRTEELWRAAHFTFFGFLLALGLLHLARLLRGVRTVNVFFILAAFLGLSYLFFLSHRAEDFFPDFDRFLFYWFRRSELISRTLFLGVWLTYPLIMRRIDLPPRPALLLLWLAAALFSISALFADLRACLENREMFDFVCALVLSYNLTGILMRARTGDFRGIPWLVSTAVVGAAFTYDVLQPDYVAGRLPAGLIATAIVAVLASNLFGGRSLHVARSVRRLSTDLRERIGRRTSSPA